jgi:tetrahydromethanopterin S-methyltransferase subunit H
MTKSRAARNASVDAAAMPNANVETNFAQSAIDLAEAFTITQDALAAAIKGELVRISEVASKCKGISRETFKTVFEPTLQAAFAKRLASDGAVRNKLSLYRVAFLAIANGCKVPAKIIGVQTFVDDIARTYLNAAEAKALAAQGKAVKAKGGRKAGTASHNTPKAVKLSPADIVKQFAAMFGGDATAQSWRCDAIAQIIKADPQGLLFDAKLGDILDSLE